MRNHARHTWLFVTALASISVLAPSQDLTDGQRAAIHALFARWARPGSPGVSVAIVREGRQIFGKCFGLAQIEYDIPIEPSTVFHVASVTKQFTAFALVLVAADEKLSLDDDLRKHVPKLHDFGETITIRHLLNHTSGLRDQWTLLAISGYRLDDVLTKGHILRILHQQRELNFPPGSQMLYSNTGYTLAAHIVEVVSGQPFEEFCRTRIFAPLGMQRTHMHTDHRQVVPGRAYSYSPDSDGWRKAVLSYANAGATSLFTTAPDLVRWLDNLGSGKVGGKDAVSALTTRGVLKDGTSIGYALGIAHGERRGRPTLTHGGADAGFRSFVLWYPEERLGVVVLGNAANLNANAKARLIGDVLHGEHETASARRPRGSGPRPVKIAPAIYAHDVGTYGKPGQPRIEVTRKDDRFVIEVVGHPHSLAMPRSATEFFTPSASVRFRFKRKGNGPATAIYWTERGKSIRSDRVEPGAPRPKFGEHAGRYYCPELEVFYEIVVEGERVKARHRRHGDLPLVPAGEDRLVGRTWYFGSLTFERKNGKVIGFRLNSGRVLGLKFVRVD